MEPVPPIAVVVESLGFGWAQLRVLLFGQGGIFFNEGVALVAFNLITISMASDLNLSTQAKSMLATLAFIGLFAGIVCSGYVSDVFGRRLPCIMAYGITALCLLLCSLLPNWGSIIVSGLGVGFGAGFGMPASIAMLSEVTPTDWRMAMRAAGGFQFNVGTVFVCLLAGIDDPFLVHLNWRLLLRNAAIPVALLCVLSAAFLPESPVFLATKGYQIDAEREFRLFARRNGKTISGTFALASRESMQTLSVREQFKVIASQRYRYATFAAMYVCLCANITMYGTLYAGPQIFVKISAVPAAWQTMMAVGPGGAAVILAGAVAHRFSRKTPIMFALIIGASCLVATCIGGSRPPPRAWYFEGLFQYGNLIGSCGVAILFTVLFQLAVEMYPATSAATGASLVIGFGRVGAMIAPSLFDLMTKEFASWQAFYYFLAALNALGIVIWAFVPAHIGQVTSQADDDASQALVSIDKRMTASYLNSNNPIVKEA